MNTVPDSFDYRGKHFVLVDRTTKVWGIQLDDEHLGTLEMVQTEGTEATTEWWVTPTTGKASAAFPDWTTALKDFIDRAVLADA